jgi:outer membrane protein assembly factor BamA
MRLDFQQELRFRTRSAWQWAWFMDAGNVWLLEDGAPDVASFDSTKSSGLAWSTGTGLRYDLEFFILRVDAALRLHDPLQMDGARWLKFSQPRGAVHLGLGLPF